ncbi:hypothetical protein [Wenzhouxiangella limi]|uniref:Uncharacterized protein n=1 Tax=Wenzhouxiangella limi TaxID=2707351 RepID=A0A845UX18_9GAMM|nr:hypothetical protein [Wenzhouxiangella limi]NDY94380.1 hypothetical protein [Wenzhouxiangella limi]
MRGVFFVILILFSSYSWGCLEAPLPKAPSETNWTASWQNSTGSEALDVALWRHECPDGSELLLMNFDPVVGKPFICSISFDVVQNGGQYENFTLLSDPQSTSSSFCSDLLINTTFLVSQRRFDAQWNISEPFDLYWNSDLLMRVGLPGEIFRDRFQNKNTSVDACFDSPLPIKAKSPIWTAVSREPFNDSETKVTLWRQKCPDGKVLLLATFTPISGMPPFVCTVDFELIQNGVQIDNFILDFDNSSGTDSFCSRLQIEMTFLVNQYSYKTQWDDTAEFSLFWDSEFLMQVGAWAGATE